MHILTNTWYGIFFSLATVISFFFVLIFISLKTKMSHLFMFICQIVFCEVSVQIFCQDFFFCHLFLSHQVLRILYTSWIQVFYQKFYLQISFSKCDLPFHYLKIDFEEQKCIILIKYSLLILMAHAFEVIAKKTLS